MHKPHSSSEQSSDLRSIFFDHLPKRVLAIEESWNELTEGGWDKHAASRLFLRLQDMSGAAGKFGLIRVSEVLLALERNLRTLISEVKSPTAAQIEQVNGLIKRLKTLSFDGKNPKNAALLRPEKKKPRIFCLCPSEGLGPRLRRALEAIYFSVSRFEDIEKLLDEYEKKPPAAIIVEGRLLPNIEPLAEQLKKSKARRGSAPTLAVISSSSALETRLNALRAGADAYFVTPIDAGAVAARIKQLVAQKPSETYRILVVEDDPSQADFAAAILRKADMEISTVNAPAEVLSAMETFRPDLILMDLYMPEADGAELTSIIREQQEFVGIPIIFLSGEQDADKQVEALGAGADDFISKPIRPKHLVAIIKNRVQRTRALKAQSTAESHRDPITGLYNRRRFLESVDNELTADKAHPSARAVLVAELDRAEEIQKRIGSGQLYALLAEIGSLIASRIEPQDVAARLEEHNFAVLTKRPLEKDVTALAEELRKVVAHTRFEGENQNTRTTLSIGVCFFDAAPHDTAGLVGRAAQTCRLARSRGGNRVETYHMGAAPDIETLPGERNTLDLINEALAHDGFQVLFQPFVDLHDQESENYQMMLRLRTDSGERIPAAELLPVAREAGLTKEVDHWLMGRALEVMDQHRRAGGKIRLLLSQSAETLAEEKHIEWLRQQLRQRLLVGTGLILEINLVDAANDIKAARKLIAQLRQMGIGVCLARFGHNETSYKILQYLGTGYIKVVEKMLGADSKIISYLIRKAHQSGALVILPQVDDPQLIGERWLNAADFVQGDAIQVPHEEPDYDFSEPLF